MDTLKEVLSFISAILGLITALILLYAQMNEKRKQASRKNKLQKKKSEVESRPDPDDPVQLREMLLGDLNNGILRKRYLSTRTPWLKIVDGVSSSFITLRMKWGIGIEIGGILMLLPVHILINNRYVEPTAIIPFFMMIIGGFYVVIDELVCTLRQRRVWKELGPLPANSPLNLAEARKRFLNE